MYVAELLLSTSICKMSPAETPVVHPVKPCELEKSEVDKVGLALPVIEFPAVGETVFFHTSIIAEVVTSDTKFHLFITPLKGLITLVCGLLPV
jgi:hypothetical protein